MNLRTLRREPAELVRQAMTDVSGWQPDALTDDVPLTELAPDSFAMVELALALQDAVPGGLDSEALRGARTVGDVIAIARQGTGTDSAAVDR